MITCINNLKDYREAEKEWRDIVEFNTREYFTPEEKQRLNFLEEVMFAWAYVHAEEIWNL